MKLNFPKISGRIISRTLLGLLLITGLLLWFAGSDSALQWSAKQTELLSNGKLTLHNVHGSLYGPLHIEALSYQTEEMRFELKEIKLDWSPRSLLKRHIQISKLSVQELKVIQISPATEPVKLPASLQFPYSLSAPENSLKRLVLIDGASEVTLNDIRFGVIKSADHYQLNLHSFDTGIGRAEAEVLLGDTLPFSITAHATLQQTEGWLLDAVADVTGSLEQLLLKAQVNALDGKANINATLKPFEKSPLVAAHITADGINPARLRKDLPEAALGAAISVQGLPDGELKGSVKLHNNLPGLWDQSRLPLREMSLQFSGMPDQLALQAIHLDMDKAGEFNGNGEIKNGQLQLALNTRGINPHELHSKIRQMQLAGKVRLQATPLGQQLSATLHDPHFKLQVSGHHQKNEIQLDAATLQSASGNLTLHGKLALDQDMPYQLSGKLQKINPADFGDFPEASVNSTFSAAGKLAGDAQAALKFSLTDSHYNQQPLSGRGKINVSATHIRDSDISLRLGNNRLEIKGDLGNTHDSLKLDINAPKLAELDPELGGQLVASAILGGQFSAPTGNVDIQAANFSWHKHFYIDSLNVKGQMDKGPDGPLSMDANLHGFVTPQLSVASAGLNARGTRLQHTLKFIAKNPDFEVNSRISGGFNQGSAWSGVLEELSGHARQKFALKSAVKLEFASQHFMLGQAIFNYGDGSLVLHEIAYQAGNFSSSGELNKLSLSGLQKLTEQTADLKTDLVISGKWNVEIAEEIKGQIAIWRDSGDISLPTRPQTTLGLSRLSLNITAEKNKLQGRLQADGSKLGSLKADAQVMLSRRKDNWGIAANAPINANANLAVDSLAWIAPLLNREDALAFDGSIKAEIHADGTVAQPRLAGEVTGERFMVGLKNQGLLLTDGSFHVQLRDQELLLDQLNLRGGDGSLSGQGKLTLEGETPVMHLALKADKLEIFSRPDRLLILSGTADLSSSGNKVQIESTLKADQGLIELPEDNELTISDDVTVTGKYDDTEKKGMPYVTSFNLDLDLGEHFYLKGKGLDAQLGGTLNLTSKNGALPTSRGSIRVIKGAYTAYGNRLVVERGILTFQGPLDNPGLNILAMRKNQTVEAGVAVTGTAQSPRVKLVSNPNVPDSEKLSWLVLGYGLENSSGKDFNALNMAAGTLLAAGESITLQQKIAHATGFEDVSLRGSGELQGAVLSLGKRISSRAYINYEQGLTSASSLIKINYTLTKRLSVQAQAGTTPAMDLFYTFSFD